MKAFATYVQTDTTEAKGGLRQDKIFTKVDYAVSYLESIPDPFGTKRTWVWDEGVGRFGLNEVRPIEIFDEDLAVEVTKRNALIAAARAKLSPEELEALGIT